jgi:Na+/melibiose symporter-like transporter
MAEAVTVKPTEQKADVLGLLKSNSAFRLLWLSRIVSVIGSSLSLVVLILYTATSTASGLAVALLMLVSDLAPTVLSPILGTLSDRVDRKRVMVLCELAQGLIIASIALFTPPLPILLILMGFKTVLSHLFGTTSRSAVPDLIKDEDLESANSALGLGSTSTTTRAAKRAQTRVMI